MDSERVRGLVTSYPPSGVRLRAVAAVLPAPCRSAAGPLGPRTRLSARPLIGRADRSRRTRPPASASGRWPLYFPLLAAPRPGRSGHGLACRLALLSGARIGHVVPP